MKTPQIGGHFDGILELKPLLFGVDRTGDRTMLQLKLEQTNLITEEAIGFLCLSDLSLL